MQLLQHPTNALNEIQFMASIKLVRVLAHSKMAESIVLSGVSSRVLSNSKGKVSEYACNKCSIYENQLKEALEELESTRMIIDILRTELITPTKTACANDSASN